MWGLILFLKILTAGDTCVLKNMLRIIRGVNCLLYSSTYMRVHRMVLTFLLHAQID